MNLVDLFQALTLKIVRAMMTVMPKMLIQKIAMTEEETIKDQRTIIEHKCMY